MVATLLINAEEREALDSHGSAANFYDEAMTTLRHVLGGRDPHELWKERSPECGELRGAANIPHNKTWSDYYHDDAWHGARTPDAKEYRETYGSKDD